MFEFLRSITAPAFVKEGGTSSQFLKADGSVDGNAYPSASFTSLAENDLLTYDATNSIWKNETVSSALSSWVGSTNLTTAGNLTTTSLSSETSLQIYSVTVPANIEIGRVDGVASTPHLDFHSGSTLTDYDSRLIASGGTGVSGGGVLTAYTSTFSVIGSLSVNKTAGVVALFGEVSGAGTRIHNRLEALPTTGTETNIAWLESTSGFPAGSLLLGSRPGVGQVILSASGAANFIITATGDCVVNTTTLATSATTGFLQIPSCAGTPTGVPTLGYTGASPLVVDSTNNKLCFYNSGWKQIPTLNTVAGQLLTLSGTLTGATKSSAFSATPTIQNVSVLASSFVSSPSVLNGYTLPNLYHFYTTTNAPAAITNQASFFADASGATSNYGFYGNLLAASNTYNFYAGGTADNYFKGTTKFGANNAVVFDTSASADTFKVNSDNSIKLGKTTINATGDFVTNFYGLPGDSWKDVHKWYSSDVADSYYFKLEYQWSTIQGIKYRLFNTTTNNKTCTILFGTLSEGLQLGTNDITRCTFDSNGNVIINTAALATTATNGFLWIPSCAGAPTGSPTAPYTNASALITDTTNNNFVHRSGSTWVTNTKLTGEGSALGWKDIIGVYIPHASGGPAPTLTQVGGGFYYAYAFAVDDVAYYTFHINHDYAPGTNIFLHAHFMCSGTNTNSIVWEFTYSFAKGHNQATNGNFDYIGTTVSKTYAMTTTAQYRHHIAEIDAGILGAILEVDGLLIVRVARRTNGGTNNTDTCWMLCADVHYQMDRSATKNKAPSFYV